MTDLNPIDSAQTARFCGMKSFMKLPYGEIRDGLDFAIVGVPSDAGSFYRVGARFGPQAIREASLLLRPYNQALDIDVFEHCSGVDSGDVPIVPGNIDDSFDAIVTFASHLVEKRITLIFLGGDHAITLGELRVVAARYGPVGLVHFDAHADTRDESFGRRYSNGTPFRRAVEEGLLDMRHAIQVGMRGPIYSRQDVQSTLDLGFNVVTSYDVREMGIPATLNRIREKVAGVPVFLSFDIDFVDPAYAPGTGGPEPGGFTSAEALDFVRGLSGLDFVAFDLVELLPSFDPTQITAVLAANIVYEFLSLIALGRSEIGETRL